MFFKLSLRNVKRSFKDYAIYFLTLTFGVCIFYMFNSLESQNAVLKLNETQSSLIDSLTQVMGAVSVFVAFIIGFLIIYANKFLIRKRKKEMGLYISLGMSKRKISTMLLIETLLIGIVSLTSGIILGVGLSQGLAGLTAKLFEVSLSEYKFIFSSETLIKTIIYFGIMFIIVMIFNTFIISKYKLIDLLNGEKTNESLKIKGKYQTLISVVIFALSTVCIGYAYHLILNNGLVEIDITFYTSIGLGIIGTFLFFFSLSGFLLKVLQSNKKIYLKNLNMFILRQINSKVNTTFISMSIICLMLFFTIGILSTGLSMNSVMKKQIESVTPYDVSFSTFGDENSINNTSVLKELGKFDFNPIPYAKDYVEYFAYESDFSLQPIFKLSKDSSISNNKFIADSYASVVKLSDYNKLQKLKGKEEITLNNNQALLSSNFSKLYETINEYISKNNLTIGGKNYTPVKKVVEESLQTDMVGNMVVIILPDNEVKNFPRISSILNINYRDNEGESIEKSLQKEISNMQEKFRASQDNKSEKEKLPYISANTKGTLAGTLSGIKVLFLYVGIYIGIVFLISSAAVLAIQQLSEATDNIKRYEVLRKIGVSKSMANKSMFAQTFIYFMMPLSLALVHSVVGIKVAKNLVSNFGDYDIMFTSIITAGIICVIYGGYFIATYFGYKNIVNGK